MIFRECFSKWGHIYPEMPKARKYYQELGAFVQKKKNVFYDLPELGIELQKYAQEKIEFENAWDTFQFNLKDENVIQSQEIVTRSRDLERKIVNLEKSSIEVDQRKSDAEYLKKLQKRRNLVQYILELDQNNGVDGANLMDDDFEEPRSENLGRLKKDQRFWRNLGHFYNGNGYSGGIDHKSKMEILEIQILDVNNQLDQMEEEESNRQRMMEEERQRELVRQREQEYEHAHHYQEDSRYDADEREGDFSVQRQADEEFRRREEEERERLSKMESENLELERSIRRLEDQKRKIEVKVTRPN